MPQVVGYQKDQTKTSKDLPIDDGTFDYKEPGFSLAIDSVGSLAQTDVNKIFGQLGALLSVAIFEKRHEAIEIKGPSQKKVFT